MSEKKKLRISIILILGDGKWGKIKKGRPKVGRKDWPQDRSRRPVDTKLWLW